MISETYPFGQGLGQYDRSSSGMISLNVQEAIAAIMKLSFIIAPLFVNAWDW